MDDIEMVSPEDTCPTPDSICQTPKSHSSQDEFFTPLLQRASARARNNKSAQLANEAERFLSDLNNYLPLGCLAYKDHAASAEEQETGVWRDITYFPDLPAFEETLYSHIQKLAQAGWIRIFSARSNADPRYLVLRIYILPFDVGHRFVDRQNKRLEAALECLIAEIDVSPHSWKGDFLPERAIKFDMWATSDEGSLFWMFNKLPSPSPSVGKVQEKYAREALEDLLDSTSTIRGLKTQLYPYQCRSAGLMLQRESTSTLELDPRLERRTAPDGTSFYYSARAKEVLRHPRYYEACKGGILAESMGLGKTVMCLALILSTKDHAPKVPTPHDMPPVRRSTATLADMAISAITRKSVPWQVEFERVQYASGNTMSSCRARLEKNPPSYDIPTEPSRFNRKTIVPPPKTMMLASTTLVVVPRNLCKQWQSEIRKHVEEGFLRMLVMDDSKKPLPVAEELRMYDIVLFTRGRFEMEVKDGADDRGRRLGATTLECRCFYIGASRIRDCHCIKRDELYDSPLKHLHFKRLIIDEGHFFSSTNTAVAVANKLVTADHRWVVSGTPAKDLLGVEVDMAASENLWQTAETKESRDAALEQRRHFSKDDTSGAIKSIGSLASNFLRIKPWYASDKGEPKADWEDFIYRHEDLKKRTFSGFSTCLRRILEGMVVKTQPEDVERDIDLPPLSHEVVRLEPSFYDKLTANLFNLVLLANAVTSERTDVDYLFHKNSQKARSQLISNLRQSAFFWTGFSEDDVMASAKSSRAYLKKEGTNCTAADRELLTEALKEGDRTLGSHGWKALSRSHEIGLFVRGWPGDSATFWNFDPSRSPLLTGVSQLLDAQKQVNERAGEADPGEGMAGAGIRALASAKAPTTQEKKQKKQENEDKPVLTKSGVPSSSIDGEPALKRRGSLAGNKTSPKKKTVNNVTKPERSKRRKSDTKVEHTNAGAITKNGLDSTVDQDDTWNFAEDSPFLQARIVGTTSAKLSYLISQILNFYEQEKILIFYDGDNVAYYIAQVLELLHIKHEIYARSLAAHLKSEYVVRFDQEAQDRVLLMDVRNAAFGLNLPSASRIYFVNPVCRPNIEAQAIKRAHRIGQTRKVFVETLVLKGTIEEKMLERSKRMTRTEHREANHLEDDGGIRHIIQSAKMLPILQSEKTSPGDQSAPLEEPQQLWGRPGWKQFTGFKRVGTNDGTPRKRKLDSSVQAASTGSDDPSPPRKRATIRTLAFVDCRDSEIMDRQSFERVESEDDEDEDESMLDQPVQPERNPSPTPTNLPIHPSLKVRSEDPYMPNISHTYAGNSLRQAPGPTVLDSGPHSNFITPSYRKVSISQLVNYDQPGNPPRQPLLDGDQRNLMREILARL